MKTLGFVGTGGMGSGMAANLLQAGYSLVVYDLRREVTRRLEDRGAQFEGSPKAVAESSEVVLSMLPHNDAVWQVGLGKGGFHEAATGARLWIECSSIDKKTVMGVHQELQKKGWMILDASAGGVEEHAAAGTLSLWVSGSKDLFDEQLPVLEAMGNKVIHVGELGNAKLIKNAMAMLAAIQHMGMAEIFNWLKKGGVSEAAFHNVLRNSQNHSEAVERVCQTLVSRKFKPRKSWMPKDVGFGLEMAKDMEVPVPFSALADQLFSVAQANGLGGYEATGIAYHVYELLSGQSKGIREGRALRK
jgi:3-hydroxyisobutyrate dehydrogenase-like beta-hydroxyacid dehydrogenase